MNQNQNTLPLLQDWFVSDINKDTLISTIIKILEKQGQIKCEKNDSVFFHEFNTVASKVFKAEIKNVQLLAPDKALKRINEIVINEFVKFKLNQVNKKKEITTNTVVQKNKEVYRINLTEYETKFEQPLENVVQLKLLKVFIPNEHYTVNQTNNCLIYKLKLAKDRELYSEFFKLFIEPGNYSPENFIKQLNEQTSLTFSLTNSGKIKITNDAEFIIDKQSSILDILGISLDNFSTTNNVSSVTSAVTEMVSMYPLKLSKPKFVTLEIKSNNDNIIFTEPIEIGKIVTFDVNVSPAVRDFSKPYTISSFDLSLYIKNCKCKYLLNNQEFNVIVQITEMGH